MLALLAPAKLNLGLRLIARRPDGYHEIETFFLPLRLCDRLELERGTPGAGIELAIAGADLPTGKENLVVRAAEAACAELGVPPDLRVRLEKRIPIAAGLGGGSSDAALTLIGVETLLGRQLDLARRQALARALGADVPFFLDPRPALGRGIGDELEPVESVPEMCWVLVAFPFGIPTPWAYQEASRELTLPRPRSSIAPPSGPGRWASLAPNDLEIPAARRHPEIRDAQAALDRAGASMTGMSGSGPTVFGRFSSMEEALRIAGEVELPRGARALVATSPASGPASGADQPYWGVAKR